MAGDGTLPTGTVTFLFTDIEGSTRLWQQHPDEMKGALIDHDRILTTSIDSHAGRTFSTAGDSFAAAFPRASDALSAAVSAQLAISELAWGNTLIKVRMGIHTGEAQERGGDYFGPVLNEGARLMSAAHGGQTIISSTTAELAGKDLPDGVGLVDLGDHLLKDVLDPVRVYQVVPPDLESDFPPLRTTNPRRNNLPEELSSFIGRGQDIDEVRTLVEDGRVVTLVGGGGVGKTRLSLQVANIVGDSFRDGVWFVELDSISRPELVPKLVATALDVQEQGDRPIGESLLFERAESELLLVLDNCEHLLGAVSELVDVLVASCPGIRILATSRERLNVQGELVWAVDPMPTPDASSSQAALLDNPSVRLFVERATLADRTFALGADNADACAEICIRLDGVPLAIELAAARMGSMSARQIANRLDQRLSLLTTGTRTSDARQQTLRGAIDWSYELLEPEERQLLRLLAVFRGGFTLEAVEGMWSAIDKDAIAVDVLSQLVTKSLVVREQSDRYALLETIRQYADERLVEFGEAEAAVNGHNKWFTTWSSEQGRLVATRQQLVALSALETDLDNLRAVLERSMESGDLESAMRIASNISFFWFLHSHFGESGIWYVRLIETDAGVQDHVRAKLLIGAGEFSMSMSRHDEAASRLGEARQIAQRLGSARLEGWAVAYLMTNESWRLRSDEALALGEEGIDLFQTAGDMHGVGYVTFMRAAIGYLDLHLQGALTPEAAEDVVGGLQPLVVVAESLGERNLIGHLSDLLGPVVLETGRVDQAAAHALRAVESFDTLGNQICLAHALDHVALIRARGGYPESAVTLLGASTALREQLGVSARAAEMVAFDAALSEARESLAEHAFEQAWAIGLQTPRVEAVALVSETLS
jgi:predicted ATPase/class 3 adenylate cyclase